MNVLLGEGWMPPLVAAVAAVLVAVAGAVLTTIDPWYRALRVPAWKPPDWAFGPVWTVIFSLTATSAVLAWNGDADSGSRAAVLAAFALNGVLNIAWSLLFFRMRRPDWALVEIVFLWLSIVLLIGVAGRVSTTAGLLNLPYLAWVSVAGFLNFRIVRLNPRLREA
ncbi:TspO/MBR family protein [Methylobacterium trifolii]|uniref:Tryptophan-rich sensory protein n=1 Tax=Methylobacterium trifolii TaxID=1003092 RepID=A0ABQ4U184_9HYPH|nr:TspO/MBR family protein [Methylobacterium trifolii]GJE60097.1 hypothetical protein MPOCJGCO_2207 [Methylobacterium trifolii]